MGDNAEMNTKINQALGAGGLNYKAGSVKVRHLLDAFIPTSARKPFARRWCNR